MLQNLDHPYKVQNVLVSDNSCHQNNLMYLGIVSGILLEWWTPFFQKVFPHTVFGGDGDGSSIGVQVCLDLVIVTANRIHLIFIPKLFILKLFGETLWPFDEGTDVLEEMSPLRIYYQLLIFHQCRRWLS